MNWFFILLINALAVHRITKLVIDDKITEPLRDWLFDRWSPQDTWTYLFTCPWCVSIWAGAFAVAGIFLFWSVWFPLSLILCLSSIVGLITVIEDRV